jgi:VIT1/CCC1 family predicted Fe2+/Mn2+ transporter
MMSAIELDFHTRIDPHRHGSELSDVILGGQDGLVNVLGVILGVAAATADTRIVLAGGAAAALAESVSMAAVAYTTRRAEHALFESEAARERRHFERVPALETEEVREMYRAKGFRGALLEQIVATITANKDVWLAVMMSEELRLKPIEGRRAARAALVVGVSALVGSLLPLVPFFIVAVRPATWLAVGIAAVTLFGVGVYKSLSTVGSWILGGLEMTGIGLAAAAIGWPTRAAEAAGSRPATPDRRPGAHASLARRRACRASARQGERGDGSSWPRRWRNIRGRARGLAPGADAGRACGAQGGAGVRP